MPTIAQLAEAVQAGDLARTAALLRASPELIHIDRAGDDEHRALHYAVLARNPAMVRLLMQAGADARKGIFPHRDATSALTLARDRDYTDIVAIIQEEECLRPAVESPAATSPKLSWRTGGPLSQAVREGHIDAVRLLLDQGVDPDEPTPVEDLENPPVSAGSPLWLAARAGRRDLVELLLDRGADPNANVYASGWAIDHAYRNHDEPLKQLLLDHGARPQPWTIAMAHDVPTARRMLESDPSEDNAREFTWSAACNGCPEIVALALPRLTWPRDDPRWDWILIQPMRGAGDRPDDQPYIACMRLLLDHGIDPNVSARFGQTALHFAAARPSLTPGARVQFVTLLLDHGARWDVRDHLLHSTPLGWACRWGRTEMIDLLLSRGAPFVEPDAEPWATPEAWLAKSQR